MMTYVTLKIVTCANNFSKQSDNEDYPSVLFSDGYENWELEGNMLYQYNLFRAHI